ncbi:MAG: hypothetical protein VX496_03625, partial [Planctomycetota bacterium]|nr:hypothetical protein [Planctomycetota bacterium]
MHVLKKITGCFAAFFLLLAGGLLAEENRYAFIVTGDSQYLAEKSGSPKKLDPYAEIANSRFIKLLNKFPGKTISR